MPGSETLERIINERKVLARAKTVTSNIFGPHS